MLIPCFNDGATVADTVRSALAQEPVELVVVDDGSDDPGTVAAMEALERDGVRVIRQANGGLAAARNAGLAATVAPYVLPLDADDLVEPGAVARLADVLDERPDLALVWGWYQRFGDETTVQPTAPTLDAWQITHQNDLPSTALMRREVLDAIGGYRPMHGYEDWNVWMGFAERGARGLGLPFVVYRYRRQGTRMLHQAAGRHGEILDELREAHPQLFAQRRRNWRRSSAPLALRLTLPVIEALPASRQHRRLAAGVASHLAHRRGVRLLVCRVREQGGGTAPARAPRRRAS